MEKGLLKHFSPLRYPGGKAVLSEFLADVIDLNELRGCIYFEPYAGGAGAALTLLNAGVVSEIRLNDADPRIHAFWRAALEHSERFAEKVTKVPLTIKEWKKQREICTHPNRHGFFDLGFATFYMNRCNRSGILTGAGPIGGHEQKGAWRMDVRFNREALVKRVLLLSKHRRRIKVFNEDAVDFLKGSLPRGRGRGRVFVYLDPPYVSNGRRLYLNAYELKDHDGLAKYIRTQKKLPWIMSYDDSDLVRNLYGECQMVLLPVRYTLQVKHSAQELIIAPDNIVIPSACRMGQNETILRKIA